MQGIRAPIFAASISILCLAFLCPGLSLAGTVVTAYPANAILPGTPIDSLELADLAIDPDLFLFTGNTMFDFNGTYEVDIFAAGIDPSLATSLSGLPIKEILLILGDSASATSVDVESPSSSLQGPLVPEPSTIGLCLALGLVFLAYKLFYKRSAAPSLS